jgi:hypothetical protein
MKIENRLPLLLACLRRWDRCPTERKFVEEYARPMESCSAGFFDDFHEVLTDLNWDVYRKEALQLDPEREEARLRARIQDIETLFGFPLEGEVILMGAFTGMDGYARFDQGSHRVFLGVDESHGRGRYLDVLIAHELTHVARESRPEVWEGFGLNPKMTQAEFTESQPVIEHLIGEGFSCAISELVVPGEPAWTYAYQSQDSLARILEHGPAIDRAIWRELRDPDGDYGRLYRIKPVFAHYVWAWQWVKRLLRERCGGDPRLLVARCSKDLVEDALVFNLPGELPGL